MSKLNAVIAASGILLALCAPAKASSMTVGDLYRACTSGSDVSVGYCQGFVTGIWFGLPCTPGEATTGALRQAFIIWAAKHPQKWGDDEGVGVQEAIRSAWTCQ